MMRIYPASRNGRVTWIVGRLTGLAVIALVALLTINAGASRAEAGMLEVQFTGLKLSYDAGSLEAMAGSEMATADFFLDDNLVGSFSRDDGDVLSPAFSIGVNVPASGYFAEPSGSGSFDLALQGGTYAFDLDVHDFDGFMGNNFRSFALGGSVEDVLVNQLPFMLSFDETQPLDFVLSSTNIFNVVMDDDELVSFDAHATGSIMGSGHMVPEPTAGLLLLGGSLLLATRRGRRCAA